LSTGLGLRTRSAAAALADFIVDGSLAMTTTSLIAVAGVKT
jgi:hypothetical protein